jgi:hypothetical protein
MNRSIVIVDDFYADPAAVTQHARRQAYYHPYQADEDVRSGTVAPRWLSSWFREAADCPFKSSRALIETLSAITGDTIDLRHWNMSFPIQADGKPRPDCERFQRSCLWNCAFHLKPETDQQLGEGVHNHVTDIWNGVDEKGWAGIVYLAIDAPLGAGLKLWRNRDPRRQYDWMTSKDHWELIDDLGNVYNRLILVRGSIPHSGAAGWGSTLRDGRLYQTFFFRVLDDAPSRQPCEPLLIDKLG